MTQSGNEVHGFLLLGTEDINDTLLPEMADETHVFLKVVDFGDDPEIVSACLDLVPTACWQMGDPIPGNTSATRKSSQWRFQSSLPLDLPVEEHLENLLLVLEKHSVGVRSCTERFSADICCAVYYEDFTPGIRFSTELINRIASLGVNLDLDLYFTGYSPA